MKCLNCGEDRDLVLGLCEECEGAELKIISMRWD